MTASNYVHVEEDSQYYTDLGQILSSLKSLVGKMGTVQTPIRYEGGITIIELNTPSESLDYIIKGIENSIKDGWYMDNINYLEKQ